MQFRMRVVTGLVFLGWGLSRAEDPTRGQKENETEKALSRIAQLGPGVYSLKTDNKGRIQSCVIVGQCRISTVLGIPKGLQDARTKARLACEEEFVKWLYTKVDVHQKSENETILFLEGSEENDKETLKESGKSVEKNSKRLESVAGGFVRGLQVLHVEIVEKEKSYILVMGWDAETARKIEKIGEQNPGGKKDSSGGSTEQKDGGKKLDKTITDKKLTSTDAKKFLP